MTVTADGTIAKPTISTCHEQVRFKNYGRLQHHTREELYRQLPHRWKMLLITRNCMGTAVSYGVSDWTDCGNVSVPLCPLWLLVHCGGCGSLLTGPFLVLSLSPEGVTPSACAELSAAAPRIAAGSGISLKGECVGVLLEDRLEYGEPS